MPSDELAAKRWLRELFRKLGERYPGLKTTEAQERLRAELEKQQQETTMEHHVTYQLTQDETDIFLAQDQPALEALRIQIAQALRKAGDPSHADVLLVDGTVGWTMDIH